MTMNSNATDEHNERLNDSDDGTVEHGSEVMTTGGVCLLSLCPILMC